MVCVLNRKIIHLTLLSTFFVRIVLSTFSAALEPF